ncbi:hypothetical protein PVK06_016973 [Gossypium arboreum]|uniref:Uncharacterized protein n=1 Tax=Gossypium arboreum TaxID=29729 RepID=A0ABR0Q1Y8_GOSAR|nr:hypothetical protein PVK06_016973 [Gossypium arboreum]
MFLIYMKMGGGTVAVRQVVMGQTAENPLKEEWGRGSQRSVELPSPTFHAPTRRHIRWLRRLKTFFLLGKTQVNGAIFGGGS